MENMDTFYNIRPDKRKVLFVTKNRAAYDFILEMLQRKHGTLIDGVRDGLSSYYYHCGTCFKDGEFYPFTLETAKKFFPNEDFKNLED